jgi:hypothetical protein
MRRLVLPVLAMLCVVVALAPAATQAAGPQPPDCPLLAARKAVDHPMTLPDGTKVVARDPYGGLLSRNRLFFDFSVRRPGGKHPTGGSQLDASSSFESAEGPTMTSVAFSGTGFATRVPRSSRGHDAGTLTVSGGERGAGRSYRLRVPRSGTTLLRRGSLRDVLHPGARRFLTVTGLPTGIRSASVRLVGRGASGLFAKRSSGGRCRYGTTAAIAGPEGRVVVSGGTSSGLCR